MSASGDGLSDGVASLFDAPGGVGVAVSGGGDSLALLDLAIRAGAARGCAVAAVTVDHGLRPEAADEARAVAAFCRDRGVAHETLTWKWDGAGNLSARARAARYALIGAWAVRRGLARVALGHTRDDVAEGVLIRLRRAPGVDGLARMPARFRRDGTEWRRPLLETGRAGLRAYLEARGIAWAEDPTNADPAYDRARAREILHALAPMGVGAESLAATAASLAQAQEALDTFMAREAARVVREDRGDLLLHRRPDPPVPPEIDRRLVRAALRWVAGPRAQPRHAALEDLAAALETERVRTLAGCRIAREGDWWRIGREAAAVAGLSSATDAPWDGRWHMAGPHAPDLRIAPLGEAVADCPDWRATGLPRASLMAGPAVWRGPVLVAAPLAALDRGWQATAGGRGKFAAFCLRD